AIPPTNAVRRYLVRLAMCFSLADVKCATETISCRKGTCIASRTYQRVPAGRPLRRYGGSAWFVPLPRNRLEGLLHLHTRFQMVNPLGQCLVGDELAIFRCQPAMAEPNHPVAVECALPDGAILRPTFRSAKQARGEALRDTPVVRKQGQVDVNQCVGHRKPLPCRCHAAIAVDYPLITAQDVSMEVQVLRFRELAAVLLLWPISAFSELDYIQCIQRQTRYLRQAPRQRGLAAAGIAEHGNLFHGMPRRSPLPRSPESDAESKSPGEVNSMG